jgi:hypothetical protein
VLINELKLEPCVASFILPVDWRGLNITNYTAIIKKPMDLGTLEVSGKFAQLIFSPGKL